MIIYVVMFDERRRSCGPLEWVGPIIHQPAYFDEDEAKDVRDTLTTDDRVAYVKGLEVA